MEIQPQNPEFGNNPENFHLCIIQLTLFPPFTMIAVCSLICLCTLVSFISFNMSPDQTATLLCLLP